MTASNLIGFDVKLNDNYFEMMGKQAVFTRGKKYEVKGIRRFKRKDNSIVNAAVLIDNYGVERYIARSFLFPSVEKVERWVRLIPEFFETYGCESPFETVNGVSKEYPIIRPKDSYNAENERNNVVAVVTENGQIELVYKDWIME